MDPKNPSPETPALTPIDYRRDDERFIEGYANNVYLESSAWDLRLIFGQIQPAKGPNVVVQHTAITLPWSQAKVLSYLLQFHLIGQELENGKVAVPKGVIVRPTPPSDELKKQFPNAPKIFEAVRKLYDDFVAANPDAFPSK
jgi:hypothetical protein